MPAPDISALKIDDLSAADEAHLDALSAILQEYNNAIMGPSVHSHIHLFVRDPDGRVLGGLTAETSRGWCYVDMLALSPPLRGLGFGTRLLTHAETLARARGCVGVYLNSFSFQAPDFYRSRGYTTFGQLADFPPGHTNHWLMKRL
jgi:GNAT superfamily N-acetyltransferase